MLSNSIGGCEVTLAFMIDWEEVENDARQHLSDTLMPWIDLYPDVDVTEVVDSDKPSRALLGCSSDARLLVVGSRGPGASGWRPVGFHWTQPATPLSCPGHDLPLHRRRRLSGRSVAVRSQSMGLSTISRGTDRH